VHDRVYAALRRPDHHEEDVDKVFKIKGENYETVAAQVAKRFSLKVVAITLRENPLVWKNSWTAMAYADGKVYRTNTYEVEIVDRLGAGDSFAPVSFMACSTAICNAASTMASL